MAPLLRKYKAYEAKRHPQLEIALGLGDNTGAIRGFTSGAVSIAGTTRMVTKAEAKTAMANGVLPTPHVVAHDVLAIIVHGSNPVKDLTVRQLRDIYLGKIRNWQLLGGPDMPIHPVTWNDGCASAVAFEKLVLRGEYNRYAAEHVNDVWTTESTTARVGDSPAAVGFERGHLVLDAEEGVRKKIKVLRVNGAALTPEPVRTGNYPLTWPLILYTNGYPPLGSHIHRLVTLHLSKEGQAMVEASGFFPVTAYESKAD